MRLGGVAGKTFLLDGQHPASLSNLAISSRTGLLDFPGGAGAHVVGFLFGGQLELGGLAFGLRKQGLSFGFGFGLAGLGVVEELLAFGLEFGDGGAANVIGYLCGGRANDCGFLGCGLYRVVGFANGANAYVLGLLLGKTKQLCGVGA